MAGARFAQNQSFRPKQGGGGGGGGARELDFGYDIQAERARLPG